MANIIPPQTQHWTTRSTVPYAVCTRTLTGYRAQVMLNGQGRWVREGKTGHEVAKRLLACCPNLDHVQTAMGTIEDTGCLTLGECIELAADQAT
jgi:hypothetical protein